MISSGESSLPPLVFRGYLMELMQALMNGHPSGLADERQPGVKGKDSLKKLRERVDKWSAPVLQRGQGLFWRLARS